MYLDSLLICSGLFLLTLNSVTYGANILAIMPTAIFSHQLNSRPFWKELVLRGHNLTLVTTDPMRDPSLKNIKEIDISYAYKSIEKYKVIEIASDDSSSFMDAAYAIRYASNESNVMFFQSPEGQNLIHNKDNHFDLLIVEAHLPAFIIFSWRYQIPFIGISTTDCTPYYHDAAGNPTHPVVNPDGNLPNEEVHQMTFWERLQSFIYTYTFKGLVYFRTFPREHKMLKRFFGEDIPTLGEIQSNMSMLFIATNPLFHNPRPLMPNTITIGDGMQINPPKALPRDIKDFLDGAKHGAIYFSLGSNVKGKHLNESTKSELVKTFSSLPYRVLWKIEDKINNLPENIKVAKWFPQQDVLAHPNVKLFITQGGLNSLQESLYFNKPMIGIPYFGDHFMYVKRMTYHGYGVPLSKYNITKESVTEAIKEVIENPKYAKKAEEYGEIFRDIEKPNVEKAVWWTEYVIRHKGARHLRNPMLDMPFWKVNMLDVIGVVSIVLFLIFFTFYKIVQLLLGVLGLRKSSKNVNKRKKEQ